MEIEKIQAFLQSEAAHWSYGLYSAIALHIVAEQNSRKVVPGSLSGEELVMCLWRATYAVTCPASLTDRKIQELAAMFQNINPYPIERQMRIDAAKLDKVFGRQIRSMKRANGYSERGTARADANNPHNVVVQRSAHVPMHDSCSKPAAVGWD